MTLLSASTVLASTMSANVMTITAATNAGTSFCFPNLSPLLHILTLSFFQIHSVPFTTCDDGERKCFNGSVCVQDDYPDPVTNTYKYHCDCTQAQGTTAFAGHECEQAATAYCVLGRMESQYAFCTNGGKCIRVVEDGEAHPGCRCTPEYEGKHCQYLLGNAPVEEKGQPHLLVPQTTAASEGGSGGIVIFIVVVVVASVLMGAGYYVYMRRRRAAANNVAQGSRTLDLSAANSEEVI